MANMEFNALVIEQDWSLRETIGNLVIRKLCRGKEGQVLEAVSLEAAQEVLQDIDAGSAPRVDIVFLGNIIDRDEDLIVVYESRVRFSPICELVKRIRETDSTVPMVGVSFDPELLDDIAGGEHVIIDLNPGIDACLRNPDVLEKITGLLQVQSA